MAEEKQGEGGTKPVGHVEWQFKLSIIIGAVVALWAVYYGLLSHSMAGILIMGAMIGGILPGIDMGNSAAIKMLEFGAVTLFSYFLFSHTWDKIDYLAFAAIMLGGLVFIVTLFLVLDLLLEPFGTFHSIPAGLAFSLVSVDILYHLFGVKPEIAYWSGFAIFIGYMVHLLTDAVLGIKTMGKESVKVLKLWGTSVWSTIVLYITIVISFILLPNAGELVKGVWHGIKSLF
jgi:hypothetical protein